MCCSVDSLAASQRPANQQVCLGLPSFGIPCPGGCSGRFRFGGMFLNSVKATGTKWETHGK